MTRQVPVFGVLLLVSLAASYARWTSEKDSVDADTIYVLEAKADQITEVVWDSEKLDVTLTSQKDALGSYLMAHATEQKKRPIAKPDAPAAPEEVSVDENGDPVPEEEKAKEAPNFETYEVKSEFKAGVEAEKLWEALAPFEAKRALENVSDEKLEELGLKEPEATLTIKRAGKPDKVLQVGGESYGTKDRYVRDVETQRIYMVSDDTLRPLRFGTTRLPDRELIGLETGDMTDIVVETQAGKGAFKQNNAADPKAAFWAAPGETTANESAGLWINKLIALKSADFVQPEDTPTSTTPALAVSVRAKDGSTIQLEVLRGVDPDGKEAWYAKSTYTRQLVKLHSSQVRDVVDDASTVLSPPE